MRSFYLSEFDDVDRQVISERALREAKEIINNKSEQKRWGGPRTLEQIHTNCIVGHNAEYFLMKEYGFVDNAIRYQDLYDLDGERCDIKVTSHDEKYILADCAEYRKQGWRKFPDRVYIFRFSRYNDLYEFVGRFDWNGVTAYERVS